MSTSRTVDRLVGKGLVYQRRDLSHGCEHRLSLDKWFRRQYRPPGNTGLDELKARGTRRSDCRKQALVMAKPLWRH